MLGDVSNVLIAVAGGALFAGAALIKMVSTLDSAFEAHVEFNEEASEAINRIADRVEHGEDIVLVCFEQSPKRCHRHKLQELIEKEIQRSTDTSEHTRAATSYAEFAE